MLSYAFAHPLPDKCHLNGALCENSMSQHKMDSEARALYDDWMHEGAPSPTKGTGAASVHPILVVPDLEGDASLLASAVPGLHQLSKYFRVEREYSTAFRGPVCLSNSICIALRCVSAKMSADHNMG